MYHSYFDGSTSIKNKKSSIGYVIIDACNNTVVYKSFEEITYTSSEKAERIALEALLKKLLELGIKDVIVYGDNKTIIDLAKGVQNIKLKRTKTYNRLQRLIKGFNSCSVKWVRRKQNHLADKLSKGNET